MQPGGHLTHHESHNKRQQNQWSHLLHDRRSGCHDINVARPNPCKKTWSRDGHRHIAHQRIGNQLYHTASEHTGHYGSCSSRGAEHTDKQPLRHIDAERANHHIGHHSAQDLNRKQPPYHRRDPEFTRIYLAERDQEHDKDQIGCQKRHI